MKRLVALGLVALVATACGSTGGPQSDEPSTSAGISTTLAPPATALDAWVDQQIAAGNSKVWVVKVAGEDAWLVVPHAPSAAGPEGGFRLLFTDGTLMDLPSEMRPDRWPTMVSFGGALAAVTSDDTTPVMWTLDRAEGTWARVPDLGLVEATPGDLGVNVLGDVLLLTAGTSKSDANGYDVPDDLRGVLVSPAGELTPMATPPEGVFLAFSSVVGTHALILGLDVAAGFMYPLTQPWDFDAAANQWSPVPLPDWLSCGTECTWDDAHEGGDAWMEVATDEGVVILLPDRSLGLYDANTRTWRQLDTPPFLPATPETATLDGGLLVVANQPANFEDDAAPFGTVGVLDVASGTWINAEQLRVEGWGWEGRSDGTVAMLKQFGTDRDQIDAPDYVYDSATRAWRPATAEDADRWVPLGYEIEITRLRELVG